jgi:hypothetical protein
MRRSEMSNKDKMKAVVYTRVGNMDQVEDCQGVPGEISMWDALSFVEGYDDITFAAMELVLEKGPDALMRQLNYDDIERVKEFPVIYKRAIELGILTGEE